MDMNINNYKYRWIGINIDDQKNKRIKRQMNRKMDGQKDRWIEIQMDRKIDG